MIPEILSIGPIPINSFGLMVALALLAGIYRLAISFQRHGINPDLSERYVLTAGFVGLLGARIWHIVENYSDLKDDLLGAILSSAGFTFYGGFLVACVVLFFMSRRDKLPLAPFLDSMGPALALGYAIGRLGCQLSGDGDYGMATTSLWGMSYSTGVVPTPPGILAYPTPLFESTLSLLVLALLSHLERRPSRPFRKFGAYLALISIERFLVEFLRINPRLLFGFSEAQLLAVGIFLVGLLLLVLPTGAPREVGEHS